MPGTEAAINPLDVPAYSPTFAGRLVGLHPRRAGRWLRGYRYTYPASRGVGVREGQQPPVVGAQDAENTGFASFLQLMDLLCVKECISRGFSLQKIRKAIDEVRERTGVGHFAQRELFTAGSTMYLRLCDPPGAFVELLASGQRGIQPVIEQVGSRIEFGETSRFAEKWYPLGPSEPIVVDPRIAFGSPSIVGRGIKTSNVYDLFVAEGEKLAPVCSWLDLTRPQVEAAVEFECQLLAAA